MNEPKWKLILSYLWDFHIESRSSDYNPDLHVVLSRGRYQLTTDKAIYSHEDLYVNFASILEKTLDLEKGSAQKVLILGLGLASIPIILDKINPGHWTITAVEIDEEVCDLANTYAFPKLISEVNTVITDAAIFMEIDQEKYDLICVDLFVGEATPNKFRNKNFLLQLNDHLTVGGVIVYNTLAFTKSDRLLSKEFFNDVFKKQFPQGECVNAHKNYMLINQRDWFRN